MKKILAVIIFSILFVCAVYAQVSDTVKLVFIGDVMLHQKQIEAALKENADPENPDSYDFTTYFKYVKKYFDNADLTVANMEFTCGGTPYSGYPCFCVPSSLPEEALRSGVDVFLTANNHICDKGKRGLDSTYAVYNRMKVAYTGFYASPDEENRDNPLILPVKKIKIAFINFTYGLNGFKVPEPYCVNIMDSVQVVNTIKRAVERGADFIIALPHWGIEYNLNYSSMQKKWADFLYSKGVDMIIGSHPHFVQSVEYDGRHLTVYSLGNYISNMSIRFSQIGMLAKVSLVLQQDGSISILPPDIEYLWCVRKGFPENNYTVIPIKEYLDKEDAFIEKSQYYKMKDEWNEIKKKFNIDD